MDVYERILRETNDSGMKIKIDRSFQAVVEMSGIKALSESAKRTTSATLKLDAGKNLNTMSQSAQM